MTQQETKEVEEFANTYNKQKWDRLQYSYVDAVIAGAQFLDELRKPSEPETKVGEAGEELCTILPNPSRIKNDDAKLIDKIGFIIVTTLDKFRHKRAYGNSHITGLMMDEIAALMQNCENQEESRNISQTDKELLEALKDSRDLIGNFRLKQYPPTQETWDKINIAISNYEKLNK